MYAINENTRLLFLQALNDLHKQLKAYAKKPQANAEYIERKDRQIQEMFNFYNEVENVLANIQYKGDVFNISNTPDYTEMQRLRAENRRLKQQLNQLTTPRHFNNSREREAFRYMHNSRQREFYNF